MPDQEPQQTDNNPEPDKDDGGDESKFWTTLTSVVDKAVESALSKRDKERAKNKPVGNSRSGRTDLPGFLADLMGGPFARKGDE
jgi:hypothetical protein